MAGLSEEDFAQVAAEIRDRWERAHTRDDAFRIIVEYGQKHGYKNVIAALQQRVPKRFTREKSVDEWVTERRQEESDS